MTLSQFKKYFKNKEFPPGVDKKFIEFLLALHGIGKPKAVAEGDKKRQYVHTKLKDKRGQG